MTNNVKEKEVDVDALVNELWDTVKALFLGLLIFIPNVLFYSMITVFSYAMWIYPLTAYSLGYRDMCGIFMFIAIIQTIFNKPSDKNRLSKDIWQIFTGRIFALLAVFGLCNLAWVLIG